MRHIIYICSAATKPSEQDLVNLLDQARTRNKRHNVTGMLLYEEDTYMQVLEGSHSDVGDIFASIQRDKRVDRMITLVDEAIDERDFPDWHMGFKDLRGAKPDELEGYCDFFDKEICREFANEANTLAIDLLMSFSKDAANLRPSPEEFV